MVRASPPESAVRIRHAGAEERSRPRLERTSQLALPEHAANSRPASLARRGLRYAEQRGRKNKQRPSYFPHGTSTPLEFPFIIGLGLPEVNDKAVRVLCHLLQATLAVDHGMPPVSIVSATVKDWAGLARAQRLARPLFAAHFVEAMDDLNRAIELHSERAGVYYHRAVVKEQLGDQAGAAADYDQARSLGIDVTPSDEP